MSTPLISIIIPCYNSQTYIKECLDSIVNQTYKNLEIVIVDDGSVDDTFDIIYAYNDSRIKMYRKENAGVSAARNYGLSKVSGQYLMFIDSDDCLSNKDAISTLVHNINNADVVRFSNYNLINNRLIKQRFSIERSNYKNGLSFIKSALLSNKRYSWYLWQYLFKRELWEGISFPQGKLFEDTYTIYKVLLKSNKIRILDERLYVYRFNNESLSKKINLQICLDMIDVIKDVSNNVSAMNINNLTKKLLLNNLSYGYITVVDVLYLLNEQEREIVIKKLQDNKILLENCIYGKEIIIKELIRMFGTDKVSKMLNIRRKLWKRK